MNTSMRTRSIVTALVVGAIAPVAPAAADVYAPFSEPQATQEDDGGNVVLRRDGSEAEPFFVDVKPEATAATGHAVRNPTEIAQKAAGPTQHAAVDSSDYRSVNAITATAPTSEPSSTDPVYSSANAISGPSTGEPTIVASSPADPADGFSWGDAALGAGTALVGMLGIGAAILLATRRRTGMSPSASTS